MSSSPPDLHALVLIFPDYNTLDMSGPLDVICSSGIAGKRVQVTLAAAAEMTTSFENLRMERDISFAELIADDVAAMSAAGTPISSSSPLDDRSFPRRTGMGAYDLLLVPGADKPAIVAAMENSEIVEVVRRFVAVQEEGPSSPGKRERWAMSVCTGAVFMGAAGVLAGRTATAHYRFLDYLKEVCAIGNEGKGAETTVVRKRFVDGGCTGENLHILTAGGVICGIDAALYFVRERFGVDTAKRCAGIMDHPWPLAQVKATEGFLIP